MHMFFRKASLWIIDDDPLMLALLERQLAKRRLSVTCFKNSTDAVLRLATSRPDMILLDMCMPEIDGPSAARNIRLSGYRGAIVMLTATPDLSTKTAASAFGIETVMSKPADYDIIKSLVIAAAARQKAGSAPAHAD